MPPLTPDRVTTFVYAMTFSCLLELEPYEWAACIACGDRLRLHQPDSDAPQRLLGVCVACDRWHVIEFRAGWGEGTLVCLPEAGEFLQ